MRIVIASDDGFINTCTYLCKSEYIGIILVGHKHGYFYITIQHLGVFFFCSHLTVH